MFSSFPKLIGCALILSCLNWNLPAVYCQEPSVPPSPQTTIRHSSGFEEVAQRAQEALKAGQFKEATRLYRNALKFRPQWAEGWGGLAASLYNLERFADARDAYRRTTILTPKNAASWAYLGLCEYELREYRQSFDHLFKSEQLGLGSDRDLTAQVKYHLAILWDTAGQFELGLKEISWFPAQNLGSPEIIEAIGLSVLHLPWFPYEIPKDKHELVMTAGAAGFAEVSHQPDKAKTLYEQLANSYPSERGVHYAYGKFLAKVDPDAALREYEKEIELSPSHVPARIEAGYLSLKMGQLEKGMTYARQAEKLEPRNALAHNLVGRILAEMNRNTEAIPELKQATELAPKNPEFHLNLARAYQKAGEATLAQKEMDVFNDLQKSNKAKQPSAPR